eukprot:12784988-Alexandrium_andersonii.AAC.1
MQGAISDGDGSHAEMFTLTKPLQFATLYDVIKQLHHDMVVGHAEHAYVIAYDLLWNLCSVTKASAKETTPPCALAVHEFCRCKSA